MDASLSGSKPVAQLLSGRFPADTLRVLQVTDTHMYADPAGRLLGVNTLESFQQVVGRFRDTHWPIDLMLATGDLVHDASPTGYRRLADALASFGVPVLALPGNHDVPATMARHLTAGGVTTAPVSDYGAWRFVMLDTVVAGSERGELRQDQLRVLEQALQTAPAHVLVCMHHQPVPVGSAWIDTMAIREPGPFFEVIDRYACVRGILWGHVHQRFEGWHGPVRLMASPSTCVQFAPGEDSFQVDHEPPGFRILALHFDGRIDSTVIRADELPDGLELASSGYR
jgi:3',5'-cyclic-AMP phosphodiesterase